MMGGAIFTKGPNPLYVPRMPPQVYAHVLNFCQTQLRQLFVAVTTPIEGPAKTSFGDVDIALAWPRTEFCSSQEAWNVRRRLSESEFLEAAARIIGGVRVDKVRDSKGRLGEVHVAVPWPEQFRSLIPPKTDDVSDKLSRVAENSETSDNSHYVTPIPTPSSPEAYIQIDLHVHPSLPALQWLLFKHAHGDLWNIIGPTIRALGLTADETGLHLRIPEIEKHDIKRARVLLSSDPAQVLAFLGMAGGDAQGEPWAGPFATKKEFFEYATSNRFFCGGVMFPPTKYAERDQPAGESGIGAEKGSKQAAKNDNESRYEENKKKPLRSNERRRIKYRPLFAEFLNDFLPEKRRLAAEALAKSHLDTFVHAGANTDTTNTTTRTPEEATAADDEKHLQSLLESQFPHTRTSVREECFTYFGPTIRWAYDRTLKTWIIEKQRMAIKKDIIKTIVPPPEVVVNDKGNSTSIPNTTTGDILNHQAPPPPPPPSPSPKAIKLKEEPPHDPWNGERLPPSFRGQITSALSKIVLDNDFSTLITAVGHRENTSTTAQQEEESIRQELASHHLSSASPLRDENTGLYNEDNIREYVTHSWRIVARILEGGGKRNLKEKNAAAVLK